MFTLTEPSNSDIGKFVAGQSNLPYSYAEVGATRFLRLTGAPTAAGPDANDPGRDAAAPRSYTLDHNRTELGRGAEVFQRAVDALKQWRQFNLGWVTIVPRGVKLEKGATVAVKTRTSGLWSLSAARVIYMVDEAGPVRRFGFAYGTLPDHVECGEERFLIEWNASDESVWYDILAFSKPRHPLVRLGFPYARVLQKRFVRDSLAVMRSVAKHA